MELNLLPKTGYTIRIAAYEGPFELLIDLIEKRKLSVSEIALASVTDDFIQHVKSKADFPMEDATNFIAVAATLLLIKSKSLIPELELSDEEEESISDLERRLALYEKTREAARELGRIFGHAVLMPAGEREPDIAFAPSKDLTLNTLSQSLAAALAAFEKAEELPEVRVKPLVTIEEVMDRLSTRIQSALTLSFRDFANGTRGKVEIIVSFLAMLELVKQGAIDAAQHVNFGDIQMSNTSTVLPRYS